MVSALWGTRPQAPPKDVSVQRLEEQCKRLMTSSYHPAPIHTVTCNLWSFLLNL